MSKSNTIQSIKKDCKYTDKQALKCSNCKFSNEEPCTHVDRMWYLYCNRVPGYSFRVENHGRCDEFIDKDDPS